MKIRKVGFFLLLIFMCSSAAWSQVGRYKGGKSYQVGAGFTDAGIMANFYYGINFDQTIKGAAGGGVWFGSSNEVNYEGIFLDGLGSYSIYSVRNRFYFNLIAGISFTGDFISEFKNEKFNKRFAFNYGILGGAELDFYISRTLVFNLTGSQRYYLREDFGQGRYQLFAAIRYTF